MWRTMPRSSVIYVANALKSGNCFFFFAPARHYFVYENGNAPRQQRKSVPRE
jgi:hypothetical protein